MLWWRLGYIVCIAPSPHLTCRCCQILASDSRGYFTVMVLLCQIISSSQKMIMAVFVTNV